MQDRMIEEMDRDLREIDDALRSRKDFARLRDSIEGDERRRAAGSGRYTPPKRRAKR